MTLDLSTEEVVAWLGQFEGYDESVARRLLERLRYVTADEFQTQLSQLILSRRTEQGEPIALYAERKVGSRNGVAHRLFKETRKKPNRAYGAGPPPVRSQHAGRHETGSEGIVANIITQIARRHRQAFLDHPGPDQIRRRKARRFILVTDFIGSGDQSSLYLDAAWRVASNKSWRSGRFLSFEVVCYSATAHGLKVLLEHPCRPIVSQVNACPTLASFQPYGDEDLISLCLRYGPNDSETKIPRLGYGALGALIAFAHGMPNNAPRLLFTKGRKWLPLFPHRVTSGARRQDYHDKRARLAHRLELLREKKIAELALRAGLDPNADLTLLVLAALKRRPRTAEAVSARTEIGIAEAKAAMQRARAAGWLDDVNRLTPRAYQELEYLRRSSGGKTTRYMWNDAPYFPSSLRAPAEAFS